VIYLANFAEECSRCGTSPCVVVSDPEPTGAKRHDTELCGVHFFRDKTMIDPELWNDSQEATE
jgi:hypothetical protein